MASPIDPSIPPSSTGRPLTSTKFQTDDRHHMSQTPAVGGQSLRDGLDAVLDSPSTAYSSAGTEASPDEQNV